MLALKCRLEATAIPTGKRPVRLASRIRRDHRPGGVQMPALHSCDASAAQRKKDGCANAENENM